MKILLYGHKGWIGSQLKKLIDNPILGESRLENYKDLEKEITTLKPNRIITTTGRTYGEGCNTIDYLEDKLDINLRDNLFGPINLYKICEKYKIHLTYLGTGCIFDNDEEIEYIFKEEDKPNFFGSSYSTVKGITDQYFHNCEILNIRIRMPINEENHPRNFITKITTYDKICSIHNSMTVLPDLLPIIIDLSKNKHIGTINLTNPGFISHNEILEMYKEIVDPNFTWENFTINEQNSILKSRRSNNYLDTNKLISLYPDIKHIKTSIREILEKYPKPKQLNNILVTGGCGFIGSNFINYIYNKFNNINLVNIDAMYYSASENYINEVIRDNKNYKLIKENLNNLNLLEILENNNIQYIIHFAAQSHVCTSFTNPLQYTNDNILGTHNLIEACKNYNKLKKFIHISTDEVYGESISSKKTEQSILCPTNPYAATKAGAELIVQSYIHSYNFPALITRGNNVYGPNQFPEKLIPKFIKLLKENKNVTIQGDGSCIRSFIHVNDTCSAILTILQKGKIGEIYNIGSPDEYSVLDIAQILIKKIKNIDDYEKYIEYIEDRPFNDKRYYIDDNKLKNLGWKQNVNFNDGLNLLL